MDMSFLGGRGRQAVLDIRDVHSFMLDFATTFSW
jgi:hypothetical protein